VLIEAITESIENIGEVSYGLYINKASVWNPGASKLFAMELFQNRTRSTFQIKDINYDNSTGRIKLDGLDFKDIRGKKIIIVESLLIFPRVMISVIDWLVDQGAIIECVVILIDGSMGESYSVYKHGTLNVIIGASVDLGLRVRRDCKCPLNAEVKIVDYKEY